MMLRFINAQGVAGIAASLCLALLLVLQKGETGHWKKESARFEQLYRDDQSAFATTVANYRAAAETARAADKASAERVAAEQHAIGQRSENAFETRLADARARASAERLRVESEATADPGPRGGASVSGISRTARGADQAAVENRLPPADALIATEQAIQLDELIRWIQAQAKIQPNDRR